MPLANRLIGCDFANASMLSVEVVKDEPLIKIVPHLFCILVGMEFGGALFDQSIGSLDHSVGLGGVWFGLAVFDAIVLTQLSEWMLSFGSSSIAIPKACEREFPPVVGENLLDMKRIEAQSMYRKWSDCMPCNVRAIQVI